MAVWSVEETAARVPVAVASPAAEAASAAKAVRSAEKTAVRASALVKQQQREEAAFREGPRKEGPELGPLASDAPRSGRSARRNTTRW